MHLQLRFAVKAGIMGKGYIILNNMLYLNLLRSLLLFRFFLLAAGQQEKAGHKNQINYLLQIKLPRTGASLRLAGIMPAKDPPLGGR